MAKATKKKEVEVEQYSHEKKSKRVNNPPVGLVSTQTDKLNGRTSYKHDPHIDPFLSWTGKIESPSFEVQNVSLHIHERIDPKRLVKSFLKHDSAPGYKQMSLFETPANNRPLHEEIDFYSHSKDWSNRLIAGDSLLVMNSLLHKEGMGGRIQMAYIDPPYGIKYGSNFQPFINKREVVDGNDDDLTQEPEMIRAFRDTWELGIHSYLTYLKNRLLLTKQLLTSTGSCFVQISEENIHFVRCLMDEVFGAQNYVSQIYFATTSGFETGSLSRVGDYLVWYAKDRKQLKYRQLFLPKGNLDTGDDAYKFVELQDGSRRQMTSEERNGESPLPKGSKIYRLSDLQSSGATKTDCPFEFEGEVFRPNASNHWKARYPEGMNALAKARRIMKLGNRIHYVRYLQDNPVNPINNSWMDTSFAGFATDKRYVVETNPKVIQRCVLMTTDPGDLVIDPTCGSGTTAMVCENFGRRFITCDTSRVAIALARQRLMTAKFDYFKLAHPRDGIDGGFEYVQVPHVTLGAIANGEPSQVESLYDQPVKDTKKVRVTGPFTVEAVPCLRTKPFDGSEQRIELAGEGSARTGETERQQQWRDELKASGIRALGGQVISFSRIEPFSGARFLNCRGEVIEEGGINKSAVISFGPDFGPLEQRQVEEAIREARSLKDKPNFVIFCAFAFDPEASKDIDEIEWPGVKILKSQMNSDLLTADLKKKKVSNQTFWLIGQPDVELKKAKDGNYTVTVNGFDYYNPLNGEIESGGVSRIAMWFLDTDYDDRCIFPNQVYFPMNDPKRDWTKLAKSLNGQVDEEKLEAFVGTESLPFKLGEHRKVAVKIIDDRGIESFVIKRV